MVLLNNPFSFQLKYFIVVTLQCRLQLQIQQTRCNKKNDLTFFLTKGTLLLPRDIIERVVQSKCFFFPISFARFYQTLNKNRVHKIWKLVSSQFLQIAETFLMEIYINPLDKNVQMCTKWNTQEFYYFRQPLLNSHKANDGRCWRNLIDSFEVLSISSLMGL